MCERVMRVFRVWFTTEVGLELFCDAEAKNSEEARKKAVREIKQKSPELGLVYRFAWERC